MTKDLKIKVGLVGWRRPYYFKTVLEHIMNSKGHDKFEYLVSLDKSDQVNEHVQAIRDTGFSKLKPLIMAHTSRRGCAGNVGFAFKKCFEDPTVDACIIIEDDITPSHDFFSYMENMLNRFKDDNKVFSIGSYRRRESIDEGDEDKIETHDGFSCWGWGTWRRVYEEVKDNWFGVHWNGKDGKMGASCDARGEEFLQYVNQHPTGSWAWPMNYYHRKSRLEIIPKVSRSQNVGRRDGMFVPNEDWFDQNKQDTPIWMDSDFKDTFVVDYILDMKEDHDNL